MASLGGASAMLEIFLGSQQIFRFVSCADSWSPVRCVLEKCNPSLRLEVSVLVTWAVKLLAASDIKDLAADGHQDSSVGGPAVKLAQLFGRIFTENQSWKLGAGCWWWGGCRRCEVTV